MPDVHTGDAVQRLHDYWQNVAVDDTQRRILMCSGPSGTEELCCAGIRTWAYRVCSSTVAAFAATKHWWNFKALDQNSALHIGRFGTKDAFDLRYGFCMSVESFSKLSWQPSCACALRENSKHLRVIELWVSVAEGQKGWGMFSRREWSPPGSRVPSFSQPNLYTAQKGRTN